MTLSEGTRTKIAPRKSLWLENVSLWTLSAEIRYNILLDIFIHLIYISESGVNETLTWGKFFLPMSSLSFSYWSILYLINSSPKLLITATSNIYFPSFFLFQATFQHCELLIFPHQPFHHLTFFLQYIAYTFFLCKYLYISGVILTRNSGIKSSLPHDFLKRGLLVQLPGWSRILCNVGVDDVNWILVEAYNKCWAAFWHRMNLTEGAVVFTLNPNERQINTRIGVRERLCRKSSLKAHITQRELQNPITLVNKLTFAHIMPLCPLPCFLGSA